MALYIHYWPIFTFIWMTITAIISYSIAVYRGDVYYLFPYISDTACCTPEGNIFGQMVNLGALFNFITIYVRYKVVKLSEHKGLDLIYKLVNNISLFVGLLLCLGLSIVANFPELSVQWVHCVGAAVLFTAGVNYCFLQAYLTWVSFTSTFLKYTRNILSFLAAASYVAYGICTTLSLQQAVDDNIDMLHWTKNDAGYPLHLASTFLEWIVTAIVFIYLTTFYVEFKSIQLDDNLSLIKQTT